MTIIQLYKWYIDDKMTIRILELFIDLNYYYIYYIYI